MKITREFIGGGLRALFKDGSFVQNYAIVLSGTGLNILIQILVSPILTRIYGPEAYGIFSVFNAICTNLALISTLRFPQALLLPERDSEFYALVRVCIVSALSTCILIFFALLFAAPPFLKLFQAETLIDYYFLIPIMVLLIAMNQIMGQWQYRLNAFKKSVSIDTGILIGVRFFNLLFGWLSSGMVMGLVAGDLLGKTSGVGLSWWLIIKRQIRFAFSRITIDELKNVISKYKRYPLLNFPGVWLTMFSDQLSVFFISSTFGMKSVGMLALAVSMLDLPKRLFAYSATSVFYKKAIDLHRESIERLRQLVLQMSYSFLIISLVPYGVVAVFGPELFGLLFGEEWRVSGTIASYFSMYCILELIYFSIDSVYYVLRQERRLFGFQLSTFVIRFVVLLVGTQFLFALEECLIFLAIANTIIYTVQLGYIMKLLQIKWYKHLPAFYGLIALVLLVLYVVKAGMESLNLI